MTSSTTHAVVTPARLDAARPPAPHTGRTGGRGLVRLHWPPRASDTPNALQVAVLLDARGEPLHRLRGGRWVRRSISRADCSHSTMTILACLHRCWLWPRGNRCGRLHAVEITPEGVKALARAGENEAAR
jgi:hypothetical protein